MAVLTKVADNWSTLSDQEKLEILESIEVGFPTIEELSSLGKFKILLYTEGDNTNYEISILATPKPAIIKPKGLISLNEYISINKVEVTNTISAEASIMLAVTKDLINWRTYNFENSTWEDLLLEDIHTNGIPVTQLASISNWSEFTSTIGFAYGLSILSPSNSCKIDSISITVDMKGTWNSTVLGTDYNYQYINNNILRINLLSNGDYKINYLK